MHRDPIESVHQMELKADGRQRGKELPSTRFKEHKGITLAELSAKWSDVVQVLEADGVKVVNPGHALEGALCIRYHTSHVTLALAPAVVCGPVHMWLEAAS